MHTNQQATNQVSHPMQQQPVVIGKVFQPKDMVNIVNMFNQNNQNVGKLTWCNIAFQSKKELGPSDNLLII